MSLPTWVSNGTWTQGTGNLAVDYPAGLVANDLLLLFVQSNNEAVTTPTGWTEIGTQTGQGAALTAGSTRLAVYYKVAAGTETGTFTVTDTGDHTFGITSAYRGVNVSAPINAVASTAAAASASLSWPSVTTTRNDCLLVFARGGADDAAAADRITAWANATLGAPTERYDSCAALSFGGSIGWAERGRSTAGASGTTTATNAASWAAEYRTFALNPSVMDVTPFAMSTTFVDVDITRVAPPLTPAGVSIQRVRRRI